MEEFPSFEKIIEHQNLQNENTQEVFELHIPKDFAIENKINKDSFLLLVTRSLIEEYDQGGRRKPYIRVEFQDVDENNNFVIQQGWKEFVKYHHIKMGWKLAFFLTKHNQLYVQHIKSINSFEQIPVRL